MPLGPLDCLRDFYAVPRTNKNACSHSWLCNCFQKSEKLAREHRAAQHRIRELEDLLQMQQRLTSDTQSSLSLAQEQLAEASSSLTYTTSQLESLQLEVARTPTTSSELMYRYKSLQELWDRINEALSCPICYEFIGKGKAISLLCGHTFCSDCWQNWEEKHLLEFKNSTRQGRYTGPECPECRLDNVRHGKVRIWALEEVVRLVERGNKDAKAPFDTADPEPPIRTPPRTPSPAIDVGELRPVSDDFPSASTPQLSSHGAQEGVEELALPRQSEVPSDSRGDVTPVESSERSSTPASESASMADSNIGANRNASATLVMDQGQPQLTRIAEHEEDRGIEDRADGMEIDEECASILRPRRSMPYGPIVWR